MHNLHNHKVYLNPPIPSVKVWSLQFLPDLPWGKYPYTHPPVIRSGPTLQFVRIMVPTVRRIVTPSSHSPLTQCPCIPQLVPHFFVHHLVRRRLHELPRRIHRNTSLHRTPTAETIHHLAFDPLRDVIPTNFWTCSMWVPSGLQCP